MQRRRFLEATLALGGLATFGRWRPLAADATPGGGASSVEDNLRLTPPAEGTLKVAFCISEHSNVIDMAGPWEVFQDTMLGEHGAGGHHRHPFELFTVAAAAGPVRATGGLHLIPDYAVADAPAAHVVVVPAMHRSDVVHAWLRERARSSDLVMSVCTGAFQLAGAGLLDGMTATTHHDFWDAFAKEFPQVRLERGPRFVEHPRIATAGGLTSGIDLALRVVTRYFGEAVAVATADYMEYRGTGWQVG